MSNTPDPTWPELALAGWLLAAEMSTVMWLRTARIMMGGPLATREAQRMVSEKFAAGLTLMPTLLTHARMSPEALSAATLAHYSKPVRANRRRLSRG